MLSLKKIQDQADIALLMTNYALGIDSHDWDLFAGCWDEDVEADLAGDGEFKKYHSGKEIAAIIEEAESAIDGTQHQMSNFQIDVAEDTAEGRVYLKNYQWFPNSMGDSNAIAGGYYEVKYVRKAEGWKIKRLGCTYTWHTGNYAVASLAKSLPHTK